MSEREYELYRVIQDYEALQDGFLDRIEDLETTFEQIEMAGELPKGYAAKLLMKSQKRVVKALGPHSLGKMLKGTGLVLALVLDDERFAPLKKQLAPRKRVDKPRAKPLSKEAIAQIISGTFANHGRRGAVLRHASLSPSQRKKIAKAAARIRWRKRPRHTAGLPAE